MAKAPKSAIQPTRQENYPRWYQEVIKAADMAENSEDVRGCMVIKPWGYALWENMQRSLDQMFKDTGHENAYFPLFIPISYLQKEAEHMCYTVQAAMLKVRAAADDLESLVADDLWPLPTYQEMLFIK